jgi:hypothetical protein
MSTSHGPHRKGEKKGPKSPTFKSDMWSFKVGVHENEPLHKHIDTLWSLLKPNKEYLLSLKENLNIDIFLGYRSNHDHAGVEVPYKSLDMFRELEVPFGLSIIIV